MLRFPLLFALLLCGSALVNAQFTKGQIYLGGTSSVGLTAQFEPFGMALQSQVSGSGVFLADRFLVGADVVAGVGTAQGNVNGTSFIRPFARVYFVNKSPKAPTAFAELGVGSVGTNGFSQLDVRPAAGLEIPFAPQIFGTLKLQYGIIPDDSNLAQLTFGLNALLNQLGADAGARGIPVRQGQLMLDPQFGNLIYIRPSGSGSRLISGNFGVRGGYLLSESVMLLGGVNFSLGSNKSDFFEFNNSSLGADLGLRYHFPTSRMTQFFAGGKFSYQRISFNSSGNIGTPTEFSDNNVSFMPEAGFLFFLLNNLALDPSVSLNIPLGENSFETTLLRAGIGLQFFFGGRGQAE
ncbi:outer membrane beta-barrel protein [Lewinella sp. W8]|uniref:outer membrane beta-barrel protein n=1 Tax=Lewinella sp. W8 TaxID=2528208 RepID=UPI001068A6BC|nr:outer membrane beta-barrel protein [Lewinella sp. W8]MTB49633.1 outer membrane beta-barrel protein [Lewinella sp. W8]